MVRILQDCVGASREIAEIVQCKGRDGGGQPKAREGGVKYTALL